MRLFKDMGFNNQNGENMNFPRYYPAVQKWINIENYSLINEFNCACTQMLILLLICPLKHPKNYGATLRRITCF